MYECIIGGGATGRGRGGGGDPQLHKNSQISNLTITSTRQQRSSMQSTVETVVLGHKLFFSTSMFGIGFWRNGNDIKNLIAE